MASNERLLVVSATIRGLVERRGIDPIWVAVESQLESLLAGRWIAIVQQALNSKAVVILGNIRSRRFCCSSWRSKGSASSECFEPTADRQPTFYAWLPPHFTVVPLFLTTSSFLSLDGSSGILARTFGNSSACSLEFVRGFCPHPRGSTGQPQPIGHRRSARIRGSYCSSSSFYRYCCRSCGWSTALTRELYEPIYSLQDMAVFVLSHPPHPTKRQWLHCLFAAGRTIWFYTTYCIRPHSWSFCPLQATTTTATNTTITNRKLSSRSCLSAKLSVTYLVPQNLI